MFWGYASKKKHQNSQKTKTGQKTHGIYKYRSEVVSLHPDLKLCVSMDDPAVLSGLTKLSLMSHENLRFIGVVSDGPERFVLTDESHRGSLYDFLESKEVDLTLDFKVIYLA